MEIYAEDEPISHLLLKLLSKPIAQIIQSLIDRYPQSFSREENIINKFSYKYFLQYQFHNDEITKRMNEYCTLARVHPKEYSSLIFYFFPKISLNLSNPFVSEALFKYTYIRELLSSCSIFPARASMIYISHYILSDFFYNLISKLTDPNPKDIEFIYTNIKQYLFDDLDDDNFKRILNLSVDKWSNIFSLISKIIPEIVIEDINLNFQQNLKSDCVKSSIFIKLYSKIYIPISNVTDLIPAINYILENYMTTKSHLIKKGNQIIQNFLSYSLKCPQTIELQNLNIKIMKTFDGLTQNSKFSFYSTLIMFSNNEQTAINVGNYQELLNVFKQFSRGTHKINDLLLSLIQILKGNDFSTTYLPTIFDIITKILINSKKNQIVLSDFLTAFVSKPEPVHFVSFVQHQYKILLEDNFFNKNQDAIFQFFINALMPKTGFLQNIKLNLRDPILETFKQKIYEICENFICSYKNKENSFAFATNSFIDSLSQSNFEDELAKIITNTMILPIQEFDDKYIQSEINQISSNLMQNDFSYLFNDSKGLNSIF